MRLKAVVIAGAGFYLGFWIPYYVGKYLGVAGPNLPEEPEEDRQKVVVLGSGWGGLTAAAGLDSCKFEVTLVSPRNHFVFTPQLAAVAVGKVNATSLAGKMVIFSLHLQFGS